MYPKEMPYTKETYQEPLILLNGNQIKEFSPLINVGKNQLEYKEAKPYELNTFPMF